MSSNIGRTLICRASRNSVSWGFSPAVNTAVPRGTISDFSPRSARRLQDYLTNSLVEYRYLGTLTVADDILDHSQFKLALDRFLTWFMRSQRRVAVETVGRDLDQVSLCWFLEFQARGAPHVHFYYTEYVGWKECAATWCDAIDQPWAFETSTRFEKLKSSDLWQYAAKGSAYACKRSQKELPEGVAKFGRWWGVRGCRSTVSAGSRVEIKHCNDSAVTAALELLDKRVDRWVLEGEAKLVPWKNGGGATVFFRPISPHELRAQLYGAMGRLMALGVKVDDSQEDS